MSGDVRCCRVRKIAAVVMLAAAFGIIRPDSMVAETPSTPAPQPTEEAPTVSGYYLPWPATETAYAQSHDRWEPGWKASDGDRAEGIAVAVVSPN